MIINAIMLGLTRKQALERFDDIVAFAELEEFMNLKLKNFSSGMHVRLAFAVAIQVDADILLIDEVLAVGDAAFQQKCFDEFARLKRAGKTIVFVTHDMSSVERFCDRAMLLDHGRIIDIGAPATVARHYTDVNFRAVREQVEQFGGPATMRGAPVAQVRDARFESEDGMTCTRRSRETRCASGSRCTSTPTSRTPCSRSGCATPLVSPRSPSARRSATVRSAASPPAPPSCCGSGSRTRWPPARIGLVTSVGHVEDEVMQPYDVREDIASILVHATGSGGGVADLPHTVTITRE